MFVFVSVDQRERFLLRLRLGGANNHNSAVSGWHSCSCCGQICRQHTEGFCDVLCNRHFLRSISLLVWCNFVGAVYHWHSFCNALHIPICEVCSSAHCKHLVSCKQHMADPKATLLSGYLALTQAAEDREGWRHTERLTETCSTAEDNWWWWCRYFQ